MKKQRFFKIFTVFLSLLFCLVLLELFLYFENYSKKYLKYPVKIFDKNFSTNDDIETLKYKNNLNIFIGDSFTQGEVCAGSKKDLVSQLNKLQDNYFYNLGIPNGNPIRYIQLLKNFKPNQLSNVILVLYFNDINLDKSSCYFYQKQKKELTFYPKICDSLLSSNEDSSNDTILKKLDNFLENKLKSWLLLREALINISFFKQFYNRSSWVYSFEDAKLEQNKAILNDILFIKENLKKNNVNFYVTYYPDVNYLEANNKISNVWNNFIQIADKNYDIKIYDPWKFFLKNKLSSNMVWSLTDNHPNCDAHLMMAKYINQIILKN
jgi:hypothetical protein